MISEENKQIIWKVINCVIAGLLVFLGSCSNGDITSQTIIYASIASAITAIAQFQVFAKQKEESYSKPKIFNFISL